MRTIVYVDGFNLYYGSLRGTDYKWLDLPLLFKNILQPHHNIKLVKFFTAKVADSWGDLSQSQRQNTYLNALRKYRPNVKVHLGSFLTHKIRRPLANPKGTPKIVSVLDTKEKGSDVNLAVHLLNDAWLGKCDCAVVVTNDSDIAEAMRLTKEQHPAIRIGLITPGKKKASRELKIHADFLARIRDGALRNSQLPNPVPPTNIYKPESW